MSLRENGKCGSCLTSYKVGQTVQFALVPSTTPFEDTRQTRQFAPVPSTTPFEDTRQTRQFAPVPSTTPFEDTRQTRQFALVPSTTPFENARQTEAVCPTFFQGKRRGPPHCERKSRNG